LHQRQWFVLKRLYLQSEGRLRAVCSSRCAVQCIGRATINRRIRTANVWARSQGIKCEAYGTRTGVYNPCQMSLHHCSMSVGHFMEEVWAHCRAQVYRRVSRQPQDRRRVCAILTVIQPGPTAGQDVAFT